ALLPDEGLNSGRILAQRARISRKLGETDLALGRYRHLRRKARRLKSNELLLRTWVGYGAMAQTRGNYPEVRRWSSRIVERASARGYGRLASAGHAGLMVASAVARVFDE